MRVLIVIPKLGNHHREDYDYTFPLGAGYIASFLVREGFELDAINLNHFRGRPAAVLEEQLEKISLPDVVLLGGMEAHFIQFREIIHLLNKEKMISILGGPILNGGGKRVYDILNPTYGIVGEAEETTAELLRAISNRSDPGEIKSLIYRRGNDIVANRRRDQLQEIDSLPFPELEIFDYQSYLDNTRPNAIFYTSIFDNPRIYTLCGSRGCHFKCTFCMHTIGDKYIQRSLDSIFLELEERVQQYKINIVFLVDDLMSRDKERLIDFCIRFKSLREKLSWDCRWWSNMTADILDEDIMEELVKSGCYLVGLGYESINSDILRSMRKPINPNHISDSFELVEKYPIGLQANFIFGDIMETRDSFNETLEYVKEKMDGEADMFVIAPSLGTDLFSSLITAGVIKDEIDYLVDYSISYHHRGIFMGQKPPAISSWEYYFLLRKMVVSRHQYFKNVRVKLISNDSFEFRCPCCNSVQVYSNFVFQSFGRFYYYGFCRNCYKRLTFFSPLHHIFARFMHFFFDWWYFIKKFSFVLDRMVYKLKWYWRSNVS